MRLVIDPGKEFGWAVMEGDKVVSSGACKNDTTDKLEAIRTIDNQLWNIATDYLEIEEIVLEDVVLGNNMSSYKGPVHYLYATTIAAIVLANENNMDVRLIHPNTWRSVLGLSKGGGKEATRDYVTKRTGIEFPLKKQHNEWDAIAIGLAYHDKTQQEDTKNV